MSLLASVDLEIAYITGYRIAIEDMQLSVRGGDVKSISDQTKFSQAHKPGDQLTSLYKVIPDLANDGTPVFGNEGHVLTLKIKAKALVSDECEARVSMTWQTTVDFAAEQNSALVKAAHRLSNPLAQTLKNPADPDADPHAGEKIQDGTINISLTISGPPRVHVGEIFSWRVFLVNRTDATRRLAVLVIPKRRRDYDRQRPLSSASSIVGYRPDNKDLIANAVADENIVYAKQKSARTEAAELICLTTDIRIGYV